MMRRFAQSVGLLVAMAALAQAVPTLTVGSASGNAGSTVSLPITFDPTTSSVAGFQFDLALPAGLSTGPVTAGGIISPAIKMVATSVNPPDDVIAGSTVWRFLVAASTDSSNVNATTQQMLQGQNTLAAGSALTATIAIGSGVSAGAYSVTISTFIFVDPNGNELPGTSTNNTLTVAPPPPPPPPAPPSISAFTATPAAITAGQSSTLSWTVSNATSLSINPGVGTVTGSSVLVKPTVSTTYTLTATNSGGSVTKTVTVSVTSGSSPTLTLINASGQAGQSVSLPLGFDPGSGPAVAAFQFDLVLPSGLVPGTVAWGSTLSSAIKMVATGLNPPDDLISGSTVWRFLVVASTDSSNVNATTQQMLQGQNPVSAGQAMTLTIGINANAASGTYPVTITKPYFVQADTTPIAAGTLSGSQITVAGATPPSVVTAASASPNPVTGTTTSLSVLGADPAGESTLSYSWTTTGTPPAGVSFSANGTNAAKNTTATFTKAGVYGLQVTLKDANGLTAISSTTVTVNQTVSSLTVNPSVATVGLNGTKAFSATAKDQFGNAMTAPSVTWSVSGGGTINSSGLFTAGAVAGGPFTITASGAGKSATATVTVTSATPPTITLTSPQDGASFGAPATIALAASVTPGTNAIRQVQFYHDGLLLGTDTTSPYSFSWTNVGAGTYQITAVVTDTSGLSNASNAATITVTTSVGNPLPAFDLSAWSGQTFALNQTLAFNYPVSGVTYTWTFTNIGPAAGAPGLTGMQAMNGSGASAQTSAPSESLAALGLVSGLYDLTITISQPGQAPQQATAHNISLVNADLSAFQIYPNPWRSDKHAGRKVTFANLSLGATVKIFTVSGHEVAEPTVAGTSALWDLTNFSGDKVGSGLYLYLITDTQGNKAKGKLAVIK